MNFNLLPEQIVILGLVASVLVTVFRVLYELAKKSKIVLPDWVQNVIVFAVSLVLGLLWMPASFPPVPVPVGDPAIDVPNILSYLTSMLASVTVILSFAIFIYKYLVTKLKDTLRGFLGIK